MVDIYGPSTSRGGYGGDPMEICIDDPEKNNEFSFGKQMKQREPPAAVVFDVGSRSIRAGYSNCDLPLCEVPSVVGDLTGSNTVGLDSKYVIGAESVCVPRLGMEITNCMKNGMIEDWDIFDNIIDYTYSKALFTRSALHPVVFTEPIFNEKSKREKLAEIMFEKYNVPLLYLINNALCAGYACALKTAIVVDSGETHTTVVPLRNGSVVLDAVVSTPLSGKVINLMCGSIFCNNNIELVPNYLVGRKRKVEVGRPAVWTRRKNLPVITNSWYNYMIDLVVEDFKCSVLRTSQVPLHENIMPYLSACHYEFPNGYNQMFGTERYTILEDFFDPIVGQNDRSVCSAVMTCLEKVRTIFQYATYKNVVVTGGNSLIRGFKERLSLDLSNRVQFPKGVNVVTSFDVSDKLYAAWIGGTIVANSNAFSKIAFSRQQYMEHGKTYIHEICP